MAERDGAEPYRTKHAPALVQNSVASDRRSDLYVLLAAAQLATMIGKVADSFVVLAVVVFNTAIGFIQEMRASRAIEALSRMVPQNATALRNGDSIVVPSREAVPGMGSCCKRATGGRRYALVRSEWAAHR